MRSVMGSIDSPGTRFPAMALITSASSRAANPGSWTSRLRQKLTIEQITSIFENGTAIFNTTTSKTSAMAQASLSVAWDLRERTLSHRQSLLHRESFLPARPVYSRAFRKWAFIDERLFLSLSFTHSRATFDARFQSRRRDDRKSRFRKSLSIDAARIR